MTKIEEILSTSSLHNYKHNAFSRYAYHIVGNLACLGRHTISKLICTTGKDQVDWSADYKLYNKNRIDNSGVFSTILKSIHNSESSTTPLIVAMDDTLIRKTGKKIPTTRYLRDPLGPPFQTNFVRGQRFIQISAAIKQSDYQTRMIPVAFENAPCVKKPKKSAPPTDWELYKKEMKTKNLSSYGCKMINSLKSNLKEYGANRPLWVSVDGSYTNKNVIRGLSEKTTLIGRIRADAKLYYRPEISQSLGRKKIYGLQSPTPEQLRQDLNTSYESVKAFAAGKMHDFKIKSINNLLWKTAGKNHSFKLIVIAPLGYRLTKGGKILYRDPAYIICSNTMLSIQEILQAYLWRWDIEVNFRDEKTLLGVGQAQVRNEKSVALVPQMMVASYATLLTAGELIGKTKQPVWRPKWNKYDCKKRLTANDLLQQLRYCLWGRALNQAHYGDFVDVNEQDANPSNYNIPLNSAVLAATW